MADSTMLQLPTATAIDGSEQAWISQTGTDKRVALGMIMAGSASQSTQAANTVFAGPTTGAAAAPTFRALVAADFPSALWTVSQGGTGLASLTAYALLAGGTTSTGVMQQVSGLGTLGQVLTSAGAAALPTWESIPPVVPSALTRVDDTNVTLTLGGSPTTALLAATSLTLGWAGTLAAARGGTGVSSLGTISRTDDTNVTLTLGGTPTNSTIQSVSFTMGWSGQLALARGGSNASLTASNGGIVYSDASAMAVLSGTATAGQHLVSGSNAAPSWSTSTFPSTSAAGTVLASLTANTITATAAPVLGIPGTTMGTLALSGSTSGTVTLTPQATAGSPTLTLPNTTGTLAASATAPITLNATTGAIGITAAALTRTDDTNVTLTLGGTPTTALLAATSITAGWTGQLAVGRGGTGAATFTANGVLYGNTTSAIQVTAQGAANSVLIANAGAPAFSATPTVTSITTTADSTIHGVIVGQGAGSVATNVAAGPGVLAANTTGANNIAVGSSALAVNTTGAANIGIGTNALTANTTGTNNVAIGTGALDVNTTGGSNVAIGTNALGGNIVGTSNVAIGASALLVNTASSNIAIGPSALTANTTGTPNIAIGSSALASNTIGAGNVAVGPNALTANTTGVNNMGIGTNALAVNTGGQANVAIGANALASNTTGLFLVAIGSSALTANTTGVQNVAIGLNSLIANTTGSNSTAVGTFALTGQTTGTQNTAIGDSAGSNITTATNCTVIGYNASNTDATTSNIFTLGNSSIATLRCQQTTITSLSDRRDKTDIVELDIGTDFIRGLRPVKFAWNMRDKGCVGRLEAGFIAQDLQDISRRHKAEWVGLVHDANPERLEAAPGKLLPIMVKAMQEMAAAIASLEVKVKGMEAKGA